MSIARIYAVVRLTLAGTMTSLSAQPSLAEGSQSEIIQINPSQIQTLETPPWERPANGETKAWEEKLRSDASTKFSGNLVKAAGAAAAKGFRALDELDMASASQSFSEAAVLDPRSPYPYLGFVDIYRLTMKSDKKQFCLKAAIERSTKQKMALIMIGTNLAIDGDYRQAAVFFNSVLDLDADDRHAHLMLAKTYRILGDDQKADHHQTLTKQ
ncbi:hypothetical protein PDO_4063 [Rhizobium sp. PDO1-076]|uniref:tetratricopeptide repeat protein n=1 Tax=Rhizobium sp. PDO1-076 TaxID=1125979 RepID=UPI00024E28F5|nr:hypothetical protein [Rhizobium sp. PDO1-076]EHS53678.1 hypothetical protein PDO_4063 [Rhizobium sp. PDO1-076]